MEAERRNLHRREANERLHIVESRMKFFNFDSFCNYMDCITYTGTSMISATKIPNAYTLGNSLFSTRSELRFNMLGLVHVTTHFPRQVLLILILFCVLLFLKSLSDAAFANCF